MRPVDALVETMRCPDFYPPTRWRIEYLGTCFAPPSDVPQRATGHQFVSSCAQHILPSGFQKIRYYGWMSPNNKLKLAEVRWLVWLWRAWTFWLGSAMLQPKITKRIVPTCSNCGGELELMAITNETGMLIWQRQRSARGPP